MEDNEVGTAEPDRPSPLPPACGVPGGQEGRASAGRLFKAALIVLSALFLLILGAALFIYFKIGSLQSVLAPSEANYQNSAFDSRQGRLPAPARMYVSTKPEETSALTGFIRIKEMAQKASGRVENMRKVEKEAAERDVRKAVSAFMKYADRPIVKDFIAAAKKDPDFAKALAGGDPDNPLALVGALNNMENMEGLMLKFAATYSMISPP